MPDCMHVIRNPETCHDCARYLLKCAEDEVGELERLRAENEDLKAEVALHAHSLRVARKTRREAMERAASDAVDGYVGAKYLDAIERELDAREESDG